MALMGAPVKQEAASKYNRQAISRDFKPKDLVLRRDDFGGKNSKDNNLVANWEGSYEVKANI